MEHLLRRKSRYYFNRRIPNRYRENDNRDYIRVALNTSDIKEARRLALVQNDYLEQYWESLLKFDKRHNEIAYEDVVSHARLMGFTYMPNLQLSLAPIDEIVKRLQTVKTHNIDNAIVVTALGGIDIPKIKLTAAFEKYCEYSKVKTFNKSESQFHKWKTERQRSINYFVKIIGDKEITKISRDDILTFFDWWVSRIRVENIAPNTVNKSMFQLKGILETVSDNMQLNLDIKFLFQKTHLEEDDIEPKRLPFSTDFILDVLLNEANLSGLNEEAKAVIYIMAETGLGETEQIGLQKDDIILDAEIPHVIIRIKKYQGLKTKYRRRVIPLVGFALDAFKKFPNGFERYNEKADSLSSTIGKYLRENKMLPSEQHTLYSLRHSFQDRLLAANAPDRVQADLMGHKFKRQSYGSGSSLEQKKEWLMRIKLKK